MLGEIRREAKNVRGGNNDNTNSYEDRIIPLLARRSYHLPGNSWLGDWCQWFCNNHLLFGICLHHRLHPLETWERLLALAASVSFGLVATNTVYQLYQYDPEQMEETLYEKWDYTITYGTVMLWTFGGLIHSLFDMVIWHVMACACCHPGGKFGNMPGSSRFKDCGSYILTPIICVTLGLAIYFVLKRAADQEQEAAANADGDDDMDAADEGDDFYDVNVKDIDGIQSFHFLTKYSVELVLAWLFYFPVVGTILFSGIFGCNGRLPILGGRPRDIMLVRKEDEQQVGGSRYLGF